jgi:hypothetical protein
VVESILKHDIWSVAEENISSSNHGVKRAECDDGRPSKEKVQTAPFSRAPTMLFVRAFASVIPSLRPHDAMHAAISSQRR